MKWLIGDTLSCREQFFASHLDSYGHYLREAGEQVCQAAFDINDAGQASSDFTGAPDVLFMLDRYRASTTIDARAKIAQVAAVCNPMPWDVRKLDGSPAYDLVLSSIPAMVEQARAAGCRAELMDLAFDHRALAAAMMVQERDIPCLFVGTRDGNHLKREKVLRELGDLVTCAPPTYGRAYYQLLARAKTVVHVQANWGTGCRNALRYFEAAGLGAVVVGDGAFDADPRNCIGQRTETTKEFGECIRALLDDEPSRALTALNDQAKVLQWHGYHKRVPILIDLSRSLLDGGAVVR